MAKVSTFFDISKSTTINYVKFKPLPQTILIQINLKRSLNHSYNRYLEEKVYQKTTTNNLNSYRNHFQQIYLSHNYKLFKTFAL